jgi:hypothetical protein
MADAFDAFFENLSETPNAAALNDVPDGIYNVSITDVKPISDKCMRVYMRITDGLYKDRDISMAQGISDESRIPLANLFYAVGKIALMKNAATRDLLRKGNEQTWRQIHGCTLKVSRKWEKKIDTGKTFPEHKVVVPGL